MFQLVHWCSILTHAHNDLVINCDKNLYTLSPFLRETNSHWNFLQYCRFASYMYLNKSSLDKNTKVSIYETTLVLLPKNTKYPIQTYFLRPHAVASSQRTDTWDSLEETAQRWRKWTQPKDRKPRDAANNLQFLSSKMSKKL